MFPHQNWMWPLWIKCNIFPLFDICFVHAMINPHSIGVNVELTKTRILPHFNGKYVSHVFTMKWMYFSRTKLLLLPTHWACLVMTLVTKIFCAPINYFYWALELRCTMTHLVPPKCSFHVCTCAIIFNLSMPCFKKDQGVSNTYLFVKITQPITFVCRF